MKNSKYIIKRVERVTFPRGQCSRRTQCAEPSHSNSNSIRSLMNFCRGPLSVWPRSRYANSYPRGARTLRRPPPLAYCGCIPKGSISVRGDVLPGNFSRVSSLYFLVAVGYLNEGIYIGYSAHSFSKNLWILRVITLVYNLDRALDNASRADREFFVFRILKCK